MTSYIIYDIIYIYYDIIYDIYETMISYMISKQSIQANIIYDIIDFV